MASSALRDHARLHFVVVLWGFTAILGDLIKLPSPVLVFYRVGIAAALLLVIIKAKQIRGARFGRALAPVLTNGLLLGLHWTLFFLAVHLSNVSVCMLGAATTALWTAMLEPLMVKGRKHRRYEFALGALMLGAIALVAGGDFQYRDGLIVAIASAGVGTTFSIINARFTKEHDHHVIAFYQMLGAALFTIGAVTALAWAIATQPAWLAKAELPAAMPTLLPTLPDLGWLFLLASVCTVYAYSQYIELLRRLSVFTVHLSYNLEPVYGIILAAIFFKEHEQLSPNFYLGAALILLVVLSHPFLERGKKHTALSGAMD
jgi:drug/metabolite transporter (DMT)-like permease